MAPFLMDQAGKTASRATGGAAIRLADGADALTCVADETDAGHVGLKHIADGGQQRGHIATVHP